MDKLNVDELEVHEVDVYEVEMDKVNLPSSSCLCHCLTQFAPANSLNAPF